MAKKKKTKNKAKAKTKAKTKKSKVIKKAKKAAKKSPKKAAKKEKKPIAKKNKSLKKKKTKITADWQGFFVPLDDRVLLKATGESSKTAGGLFIPDTAKERPHTAKVLSVGPGHRDLKGRLTPLDVMVGEEVLIPEFSGQVIDLRGEKLLVMRESDILGVVK